MSSLTDVFKVFAKCIMPPMKMYHTPEFNNPTLQKSIVSILQDRYMRQVNHAAVRLALILSFEWSTVPRLWKTLITSNGNSSGDEEMQLFAIVGRMSRVTAGVDSTVDSTVASGVASSTEFTAKMKADLATALTRFKMRTHLFAPLDEEDVTCRQGVLNYWLNRLDEETTADLARAALAILAVNPSEASVERTFSSQKFIHTKLRNRMSDDLIYHQMMIKCNYSTMRGGRRTQRKQQDDDSDDAMMETSDDELLA